MHLVFDVKSVRFIFQAPQNYQHVHRTQHITYRHDIINKLQEAYSMVTTVSSNLSDYLQSSRQYARG